MRDESLKNIGQTCDGMTTCGPSRQETPASGELTSSLEDSPARTFPSLDRGAGLMVKGRDCGLSLPGSFAFFDHDSFSWRTWQLSLHGGLIPFSGTWPRAGLMLNGFAYKRHPLVRRTYATERSFLPTPQAFDSKRAVMDHKSMDSSRRHKKGGCSNLAETFNGFPNPLFVEWMMGFPMGWTDLEGLETPSSRK